MTKIAVIGAGAWGTTLSILLTQNNHEVCPKNRIFKKEEQNN